MEIQATGDTRFLIISSLGGLDSLEEFRNKHTSLNHLNFLNILNKNKLIPSNDIDTKPTSSSLAKRGFENLYLASRKQENRVYTDEQLEKLPLIDPSHVHYSEWQVRKRSAARLLNYLENKNRPLTVLEAGCGNGWLSAGLGALKGSTITGTDINKTELEQARKVFGKKINVVFKEGDIREIDFADQKFDVIIFAASIQYFSSFGNIIRDALSLLNEGGEIHILDSYFYSEDEIEKAKQRSLIYYRSIGYEAMAEFYFHHAVDSLKQFNYTLLYDPAIFKNKYFGKKDPFPWICIVAK